MTQWYLVWPPACGVADTPGTSPCSVRLPCEGAASAPPPLSGAQLLPLTPLRSKMSSPHHSQHPVGEVILTPNLSTLAKMIYPRMTNDTEEDIKTDHHLLCGASHAVKLVLHTLALSLSVS